MRGAWQRGETRSTPVKWIRCASCFRKAHLAVAMHATLSQRNSIWLLTHSTFERFVGIRGLPTPTKLMLCCNISISPYDSVLVG